MATNRKHNFEIGNSEITYTNSTGSAIVSGQQIWLGDRWGIASVDIANGDSGTVLTGGVFEFGKASATVLAQGASVRLDGDDELVAHTTASGVPRPLGTMYEAAGNGTTTGLVLLNGPATGVIALRKVVTAGEVTANRVTIATGLGFELEVMAPPLVRTSAGVPRAAATDVDVTGANLDQVEFAVASMSSTDIATVLVARKSEVMPVA